MYRALTFALMLLSTIAFAQKAPTGNVNVVTRQNDNQHTGQNLQETILTPTNVNSGSFGKLFSYFVDGQIYAEPLYVQNLTMAQGGVHNVVFVATEYDSVYAFDADSAALNPKPLWHTNFLNPPSVAPVPCAQGAGICQLFPVVGITSTPVINLATNTIYAVVRTQETSGTTVNWVMRIHALDITSGAEKPGSPATICSATGNAGCPLAGDSVIFGPHHQQSRPGLLLVPQAGFPQGVLVIGFSGDSGWVLAYDPTSLALLAAFYTDSQGHVAPKTPGIPGEGHGGIWGAGAAVVADTTGNIYAITGDGLWDGVKNWGDSLVKLVLTKNTSTGTYTLVPADYFTTERSGVPLCPRSRLRIGGAVDSSTTGRRHSESYLHDGQIGEDLRSDLHGIRDQPGQHGTRWRSGLTAHGSERRSGTISGLLGERDKAVHLQWRKWGQSACVYGLVRGGEQLRGDADQHGF